MWNLIIPILSPKYTINIRNISYISNMDNIIPIVSGTLYSIFIYFTCKILIYSYSCSIEGYPPPPMPSHKLKTTITYSPFKLQISWLYLEYTIFQKFCQQKRTGFSSCPKIIKNFLLHLHISLRNPTWFFVHVKNAWSYP